MATRTTLVWTCNAGGCLKEDYGSNPEGWHRGNVVIRVRNSVEVGKWSACCSSHISPAVLTIEEAVKMDEL